MTSQNSRTTFFVLSIGSLLFAGIVGVFFMDPASAQQPTRPLRSAGFGACPGAIADHGNPGSCIAASSIPEDGMLYPLGEKLFVDSLGSVGISTKTPTTTLEIQGNFTQSLSGMLNIPMNTKTVQGFGSMFTTELSVGDAFKLDSEIFEVDQIINDNLLEVTQFAKSDHNNATGFVNIDLFSVSDGIGEPGIFVDKTGNVGVGTTSPSSKLEVIGDIVVSGTVSASGGLSGLTVSPIGSIVAWHKNLTGTPSLPAGWEECSGQVVSDSESPYDGVTLPNLNGQARFLRGSSTSGTFQADQFQTHTHSISQSAVARHTHSNAQAGQPGSCSPATQSVGPPNSGRHGSETRPVNMSVVWIIRVK